jgi:phosphopantothenoylcysteine synthetase/decarboxylase
VFVRLEAIQTEKHQTRYQPLQLYMDEKSISEHVRLWQQILIFFARTQRKHAWKSPKYRFTRRQREAWEALVEQAERSARGEEEQEEGEETETGEVEVEDEDEDEDEIMADDVNEAIDETEAEENTTAEGISELEALSSIQKACLEFCIALLSQSITRKEYDSPLVCALAVLGVKEDG